MRYFLLLATAGLLASAACQSENPAGAAPAPAVPAAANPTNSLGVVGDAADVGGATVGGTVLMGGGPDVDAAFRWMIAKAGGGDFLVLRASGTNAYNAYVYGFGGLNSCETLLLNSRALANEPLVEAKIRAAEAVFIAGGDQADYVNFWKDTRVEDALNYVRNVKRCPVGGTSAGNAIAGRIYFGALLSTISSAQALANPYDANVTLGRDDFLDLPFLANTITDTHFDNPDRRGRLVAFLARMSQDYGIVPRGVGVEEATAVCIEPDGLGRVLGRGAAHFLQQNGPANPPERCQPNTPLDWNRNRQAVAVYRVAGTAAGTHTFDFATWTGTGGTAQYFSVAQGTLQVN